MEIVEWPAMDAEAKAEVYRKIRDRMHDEVLGRLGIRPED